MNKALAFLALFAFGCWNGSSLTIEEQSSGEDMQELIRAQITDVFTTANLLGSFAGQRLPNIQVNNLEPGEYTIQFQVVEPTIDGLGSATYAVIRWKVGGQQIQRIVSVYSGAVLSGVAEAVDVQLLDQSGRGSINFTPTATVVNGSNIVALTGNVTLGANEEVVFSSQPTVAYGVIGPVSGNVLTLDSPYTGVGAAGVTFYANSHYKIGVSLSRGTRPTIMQPPVLLTQEIVTVPLSALSPPIVFPVDAGIISTLVTVTVNGAPGVGHAEAANGIVIFGSPSLALAQYIPNSFPMWFPVPPGTTGMFFINNSATEALNFSLQWGIEG
jgi:hypothetical protein